MKMTTVHSLCVLLVSACATPALAVDAVTRLNGSTVSGDVKSATREVVTVQLGARVETIPVSDIVRISWNNETPALKNARGLEQNGDLVRAAELYAQVVAAPGNISDLAKKDLQYLVARLKARTALLDPTKADEAIADLEKFKAANGDFFRYYELHEFLGRVHAAKGDADKAKTAFAELAQAPSNDLKMKGRNLIADMLVKLNDLATAEKEYADVAAMPAQTPQEIEQKNLGRLGQANCLSRQGQTDQAVALLDAIVQETDKGQAAVQARASLLKGDAYSAQGKDQKAVMSYLLVDLLFENQSELHAEALFRLSTLWAKVGESARASDARARLLNKYPKSEWVAQLK